MKFLTTTLVLCLFALFFSCSEEREEPSITASIVGNWNLTSMQYKGVSKLSMDGKNVEYPFSGVASEIDFRLDFSENPNLFTSEGGYIITLSYEIMGQQLEMPVPIENFLGHGSWDLKGDLLKVALTGNPTDEAKIIKLTADELIMEADVSGSRTENDALLGTSINGMFTFRRQN